jgi:hypothetical protein
MNLSKVNESRSCLINIKQDYFTKLREFAEKLLTRINESNTEDEKTSLCKLFEQVQEDCNRIVIEQDSLLLEIKKISVVHN